MREHELDFRLVTATNRDLDAEVRAGRFRRDPSDRPVDDPIDGAEPGRADGTAAAATRSDTTRETARTRPGTLLGSPLYMAPELWRGEPATAVTDVYALGVLLYELCAGQPPASWSERDHKARR